MPVRPEGTAVTWDEGGSLSAAFDGSGYRQRVLAPLRAGSFLDTADPFLIAGLDPTVPYTDSDIGAHLVRVLAFL
ncbi:hypothetical protein, partial [Frankia sp. CpI1-P]|uniref:hypothetical protein n=1 Tax=Frankia sp. CpI1-P TaxID=1502734 RepID=UPI001F5BF096